MQISYPTKNLEVRGIFGQSILAEGHETDGKSVKINFSTDYSDQMTLLNDVRFTTVANSLTSKLKLNNGAKVEVLLEKIDFPIKKISRLDNIPVYQTSKALNLPAFWPATVILCNSENDRVTLIVKPTHPKVAIEPVTIETSSDNVRAVNNTPFGLDLVKLKTLEVAIPMAMFPYKKRAWLRKDFYDYHFGSALIRIGNKTLDDKINIKAYSNAGHVLENIQKFFNIKWTNERLKLNLLNKINRMPSKSINYDNSFICDKITVSTAFLPYILGPRLSNISHVKSLSSCGDVTINDSKGKDDKTLELRIEANDAATVEMVKKTLHFVRYQIAFPTSLSRSMLQEESSYIQGLIKETNIFSIIFEEGPVDVTLTEINKTIYMNQQTDRVTMDNKSVEDQEYNYLILFGVSYDVERALKIIHDKFNTTLVKARHFNDGDAKKMRPMSFGNGPIAKVNKSFEQGRGRLTPSSQMSRTPLPRSSSLNRPMVSPVQRTPSTVAMPKKSFVSPQLTNTTFINKAAPMSLNSPKTPDSFLSEATTYRPMNTLRGYNDVTNVNCSVERLKAENEFEMMKMRKEMDEKFDALEKMVQQMMGILTRNLNSNNPISYD